MIHLDLAPNSPEWHAARRWRVGGSDIGALMGWSKWATAEDVLASKLSGEVRPPTARQQLGHLVEAPVIAYLLDKYALTVNADAKGTYVDEQRGLVFNPDAIAADRDGRTVLLEAKSTADRSAEDGWGRAGSAQIPLTYAAQVQYGMGLLGIDVCYLGVLGGAINGRPDLHLASYRIPHDPGVSAYLIESAAAFAADLHARRADQEVAA